MAEKSCCTCEKQSYSSCLYTYCSPGSARMAAAQTAGIIRPRHDRSRRQDLSLGHGYAFGSLKELFRDTILPKTGFPGFDSLASAQKNPFLTNWKLSYGFASMRAGSTTP